MLAAAMIASCIPSYVLADNLDLSSVAEFFLDERGNIPEIAEFKISSAETLKSFAFAIKNDDGNGGFGMSGKTIYLANDIELSGDFTPIANISYPRDGFAGTFDGCFHKISGLNVSGEAGGVGLFGTVNGGTIKNLIVSGSVSGNSTFVGGIVGKTQGTVLIENCSFSGSVTNSKSNAAAGTGGIAGRVNSGTLTITGCSNSGSISAAAGAPGGILGAGQTNAVKISSCYNTGNISGQWYPSGICATNTKNTSTIKNCYSIGEILNTNGGAYSAGISANFKGTASNCYSLYPEADALASNNNGKSTKITSPDGLLEKLVSDFTDDLSGANGGYPLLSWQTSEEPQPQNPKLEITGGPETVSMTNSGAEPTITLTANAENMDDNQIIEWEVESGKEELVELTVPTNASPSDNVRIITAKKPGKAAITAKTTYNNTEYSDSFTLSILPFITTVEIDGDAAVGSEVKAKVNILGGYEYDYENYPEISFSWKYLTADDYLSGNTTSYKTIKGAASRSFVIPDELLGCYLSFDVLAGGEIKYPSSPTVVESSAKKALLEDKRALSIDTSDIKKAKKLDLPKKINNSDITWESSDSIINAETGDVTLPEDGIKTVTLKATLTYQNETVTKSFEINVYSQKQIEEDRKNTLLPVTKTLEKLGDFFKLYPDFDSDKNIAVLFKSVLDKKAAETGQDTSEATVSVKDAKCISGEGFCGIAKDGSISYFFADPNSAPIQHSGSFDVTFEIALGDASAEFTAPVIIYWDTERVRKSIEDEIVSKIEIPSDAESEISLPKVIDGKKWAIISWSSSNEKAISISNKNQQTADTLFNPYVGIVKNGEKDENVTLTAACTFGFTNDVTGSEKPIVVFKTFTVNVSTLNNEQIKEIKSSLEAKLDAGFSKAPIKDAFSGEELTQRDGAYEVSGDIKLPTTRDFGIDGKYYPVTITSDNDEVIETPDVNNAARVSVIRPAVGKASEKVNLTVSVTDKDANVSASKTFTFIVLPLTSEEIDAETALISKVIAAYTDGIKGSNADADNISSNLSPFTEVYEKDGSLVWVRTNADMTGHGIVPTELDGWQELEAWRLFKSSNPAVISHENLIVTKQSNAKAVTVSSALSSETLGIYGKLYKSDPVKYADYAALKDLYYRPVSADFAVRGLKTASGAKPSPTADKINVSFILDGIDDTLIEKVNYNDLTEPVTVYDIFKKALADNGYTFKARGSYVYAITTPDGKTISEFDAGQNSGWMYKVNGKIGDVIMGAYGLSDGDAIDVFFTKDYTKEDYTGSSGGMGSNKNNSKADDTKDNQKTDSEKNDPNKQPNDQNSDNTPTNAPVFRDTEKHWAKDNIDKISKLGIMKGVSDSEFAPDEKLTRSMFVTILYRLEKEPESGSSKFVDTAVGSWYASAVAWASKNGVVSGIDDTHFAPDENITREQMAAIILRYASYKGYDVSVGENTNILSYTDSDAISEYAVSAIQYVVGLGLMTGRSESEINPKDTATRAETAAVIIRMIEKLK